MRKTLNKALIVALALVGAVACSADVGERTDTLRVVDEQAITGQLLYMQFDLSPFPMTAADLAATGDTETAIPVRVEVFEDISVAWFAPEGVAQVDRDGLMAIWRVVHRTPIAGEVDNNAEVGVVEPGSTPLFVVDSAVTTTTTDVTPDEQLRVLPSNLAGEAILDFQDLLTTAEEAAAIAMLVGYHPGCL